MKVSSLLVALQYGPADPLQVFVAYRGIPPHCGGGGYTHLLLDVVLVGMSVHSSCGAVAAHGVQTKLRSVHGQARLHDQCSELVSHAVISGGLVKGADSRLRGGERGEQEVTLVPRHLLQESFILKNDRDGVYSKRGVSGDHCVSGLSVLVLLALGEADDDVVAFLADVFCMQRITFFISCYG